MSRRRYTGFPKGSGPREPRLSALRRAAEGEAAQAAQAAQATFALADRTGRSGSRRINIRRTGCHIFNHT